MKFKQKTIAADITLSGIGLHTGEEVIVTLKPAEENAGILFKRVDLDNQPTIKVSAENIPNEEVLPRCTSIGNNGATIHTVEHFMSVLAGLGVTNVIIEINNSELPGLDGSGKEYLKAISDVGLVEQDSEIDVFNVTEPIGVELNGSSIYIVPADDFRISYTLNYDHPQLKSQYFESSINEETYVNDIAPCRTFCLESEANELQANGLGKGANFKNTLVIGDNGVIENELRFDDEFARHKVLDIVGDLYLMGIPIRGHIFATKSGHTLNIRLLKKIFQQREKFLKKGSAEPFVVSNRREIDFNGIMKILPHRYPFLLVDRVIEIDTGKKAIGVKNVTANEEFFKGHFPTRPVMPGVLMVEAMAQTAGVVVLTNEAHHGKVAFFMAADKIKFRKVVVPGDQLIMDVEVLKDKSRTSLVRGIARVGSDIVAEADMLFSFTDESYLE